MQMSRLLIAILSGFVLAAELTAQAPTANYYEFTEEDIGGIYYQVRQKIADKITTQGAGLLNPVTGNRKVGAPFLPRHRFSNGRIFCYLLNADGKFEPTAVIDENLRPVTLQGTPVAYAGDVLSIKEADGQYLLEIQKPNAPAPRKFAEVLVTMSIDVVAAKIGPRWRVLNSELEPVGVEFDEFIRAGSSPGTIVVRIDSAYALMNSNGTALVSGMPVPFIPMVISDPPPPLDGPIFLFAKRSLSETQEEHLYYNSTTRAIVYRRKTGSGDSFAFNDRLFIKEGASKYYVIDPTGKRVFPGEYDQVGSPQFGLLRTRVGATTTWVNWNGVPQFSRTGNGTLVAPGLIEIRTSGLTALVDINGSAVTPQGYEKISDYDLSLPAHAVRAVRLLSGGATTHTAGYLDGTFRNEIIKSDSLAFSSPFKHGYAYIEDTRHRRFFINASVEHVYELASNEFCAEFNIPGGDSASFQLLEYLNRIPNGSPPPPAQVHLFTFVNAPLARTVTLVRDGEIDRVVNYNSLNTNENVGNYDQQSLYTFVPDNSNHATRIFRDGEIFKSVSYATGNSFEAYGGVYSGNYYSFFRNGQDLEFKIFQDGKLVRTVQHAVITISFGALVGRDLFCYINDTTRRQFTIFKNGGIFKVISYAPGSQAEFFGAVVGSDYYSYRNEITARRFRLFKNGQHFRDVPYASGHGNEAFLTVSF